MRFSSRGEGTVTRGITGGWSELKFPTFSLPGRCSPSPHLIRIFGIATGQYNQQIHLTPEKPLRSFDGNVRRTVKNGNPSRIKIRWNLTTMPLPSSAYGTEGLMIVTAVLQVQKIWR